MSSVVMDITRLIDRASFATPTGIDRYELHYARWASGFVKRGKPSAESGGRGRVAHFIETGYRRPVTIRDGQAHALIADLSRKWADQEMAPAQADLLARLLAAIDGQVGWTPDGQQHRSVSSEGFRFLRKVKRKVLRNCLPFLPRSAGASLIHVSHSRLDRPSAFAWLDRAGLRCAFYIHDLIPLSHPEYVRKNEPERHRRRMETVFRHAGMVLCNSQATAAAFRSFAEEQGRDAPPIAVLPPGTEKCFSRQALSGRPLTRHPYFVVLGTIEPRKNHVLLLNLWRYLVERDGACAPRLVVAGKRGWENLHVTAMLDRCPQLRGSVFEVSGLNDAALAKLLGGAAALLSPSFAEGYGMPVAEALAVGIPVIASDIPSHREVAGDRATLLDPTDGRAWRDAVDSKAAQYDRRVNAGSTPYRWAAHFRDLESVLSESGLRTGASRPTHINQALGLL